MTKKSTCLGLIFSVFMTGIIFILGMSRNNFEDFPVELYQVYLHGEVIGTIDNKEQLYKLIDQEQTELKKKYNVDNIYPPEGLELVKIKTFNEKTLSAKEIYEKIKDLETFTIEGYVITIKKEDGNEKIYILNEEDLSVAVDNTIKAFVDEENLDMYRNNSQPEIKDVGQIIENISIREEISIEKTYISSEEEILTNERDLSRYILFGTLENQESYTVMVGDTIEDIATNNNLNVSEFLIANPEIISEYALLFPGQQVNIGLISPKISVVVETTSTELQDIPYETKVEYDNKMTVGTTYTKQQGVTGQSKATFRIETVNGADTNAVKINAEEIKTSVDKIIVKGGLSINYAGDSEYWAWPTIRPYVITSPRGWRWGSWHNGVDIAGTGHGSPIYAIQSGIITQAGYNSSMGNHCYVDHQNGYVSVYMHMAFLSDSTKKGATVLKGQTLGGMGNTGQSTGTHLHLSVWMGGAPYSSGAYDIDPLALYD